MGYSSFYFYTVWLYSIALWWFCCSLSTLFWYCVNISDSYVMNYTGHFICLLFCSSYLGSRSVYIEINYGSWVIGGSISVDLVASPPTLPVVFCWWLRCYWFPPSTTRDFQTLSFLRMQCVLLFVRINKLLVCAMHLCVPDLGIRIFFRFTVHWPYL